MATREKKARSVTADSPTPSLGSAHGGSGSYLNSGGSSTLVTSSTTTTTGNALTLTTVGGGGGGSVSAPTTPTSTRKRLASTGNASNNSTGSSGNSGLGSSASSASVGSISSTRGSSSRLKSKQLQQTAGDETVQDDTTTAADGAGSLLSVVTTTPRTTRGGTLREESSPSSTAGDVSSTSVGPTSSTSLGMERGEDRTLAGASSSSSPGSLLKDQTKSPAIGARRAAAAIAAKKFPGGASSAAVIGATSTTSTRSTDRKHRRGLALKHTTLLKRKGKKIIVKPVLGRKGGVARRPLAAVATKATAGTSVMRGAASAATATAVKKDPAPSTVRGVEALTENRTATPSLRNGKPRNSDSPVPKRKAATGAAGVKPEPVHKSPDSSSGAVTATRGGDTIRPSERRRSESVLKCSVEPMAEDGGDDDDAVASAPSLDIKRELVDADTKTKSFVLDKMSETFNERKGVVSPVVSEKGGNTLLRRSMRQRKSTARDKEDFVSPRQKPSGLGNAATVVIKIEPFERCDSAMGDPLEMGLGAVADRQSPVVAPAAEPLTIDTTDERRIMVEAPKDGTAVDSDTSTRVEDVLLQPEATATVASAVVELVEEKDTSSLSPELVSEGVSELSVKECYAEPAFLENNLGIEKDPKLGEIVQERFWYDKVSGDEVSSGGACEEGAEVEEEVDAKREQELPSVVVASGGGDDDNDDDDDLETELPEVDRKDSEKETEEREQGKEKAQEEEEGSEEKEDETIVNLAPEDLDEHDDVVEGQEPDDDAMIIDDDQPIAVVVVEEHSNGDDDHEVVVTKNSVVMMEQDESHELDAGGVSQGHEDHQQSGEGAMDPITNGPAMPPQRSSSFSVAEDEDVAIVDVSSPLVASSKTEPMADDSVSAASAADSITTTPPVVVIDDGEDDDDDVTDKSDQEGGGSDTKTENVSKTATQPGGSGDKHHRGGSQSPRANGDSSGSEKSCSSSSGHQTGAAAAAATAARTAGAKASAAQGGTPTKAKAGGTTQGTHGNGKGAKGGRTTKEKPKEDERTREEKLRQEKLRVEEKVREEKLRAERLEAEKRLLLHERKPVENGGLVVEDERASNAGTSSHPSSPIRSDGEGERKPEVDSPTPVPAATTLISLGALNLPAITIVKKDGATPTPPLVAAVKDEDKELMGTQKPKAAKLEVVPLKKESSSSASPPPATVPTAKDEKGPTKDTKGSGDSVESPLQIISKSEAAAAAVTVTKTLNGSGNKLSLSLSSSSSIIKIESSSGGASDEDRKELLTGGSSSSSSSRRKRTPEVVAQLPSEPAATSPAAATLLEESDDVAKQKESHLKHLGLLTIRAACEEKQRRAEQKPAVAPTTTSPSVTDMMGRDDGHTVAGREGWLAAAISQSAAGSASGGGGGGGGRSGNKSTRSSKDEYTVSMKTVLMKGSSGGARGGEKRKQQRMPLKMTFQKGKGKSSGSGGATRRNSSHGGGSTGFSGTANHHVSNGGSGSASGYVTDGGPNNGGGQDFYTIHSNEADHHSSNSSDGHTHRGEGGRKSHSRSHTTDGVGPADAVAGEPSSSKEAIQTSLVIPEKASSFNVHPERLCQDQCFYCGGKFGLFDTPCHIAALKSTERQQKILLVESKISLDSCLCDACFRHVDRKANCPSQKKKVTTATVTTPASSSSASGATGTPSQSTVSPIVIKVTTNKDGSTSIAGQQQQQQHPQLSVIDDGSGGKVREICAVRQCSVNTVPSLRRKWVLKMKRKICKHLDINLEQATKATAESIAICNKHYEQIGHLMICAMCTKPLQRNHVYHVYNNISQLERLIQEQGVPGLRLSSSELVVCKLCRYYANLLLKPPDAKSQKAQFIKSYNRRLYNTRNRNSESQEEEVEMVQHVDPSFALMNASACPARQPATVDIVISDGDEEAGDEEEEVRECPSQLQQAVEHQQFQSVSDLFSIGDSSVSLQRRVPSRKSPDVSIVENNGATQMSDLGEITIIPTTKSLSSGNSITQHQPPPAPRDDDNIDMTKVLKSNPNISMRELFPGEEELGIHVNIPFSSSSMRTPEGWTKETATIQYDDSTRALWEELQEPYGNQSSFLRHLILLERYFRNGELVLSPQAKTSATSYAEAMQNRLRSYDNKPTPSSPPALASLTPTTSVVLPAQLDKASNIFQQFSNATITIVPASRVRPKATATATSTASGSSVADGSPTAAPISLLKSNNLHLSSGGSDQHIVASSLKRKLSNEGKSFVPPSLAVVTPVPVAKVAKLDDPAKLPSSMPPELISINRKPNVTITTIPVARFAPLQPQQQSLLQSTSSQSLLQQQQLQPQAVPSGSHIASKQSPPAGIADASSAAKEIIQMPDQLTEAERRKSSPPWRPTLLPIAPGVTETLKAGPQYKTADGRLLPKLVQVMSGGKPYHISINDYNRMCILRREKLIQQQLLSANKRPGMQQPPQQTTKQASASISPSAPSTLPTLRLTTTISDGAAATVSQPVATAKMVQIPNQIFEQNSLIPIIGTTSAGGTTKLGTTASTHKSSSLTVTMTTTSASNNNNINSLTKLNSAPKPLSLPNSTTVYPMTITANTITLPSAAYSVAPGTAISSPVSNSSATSSLMLTSTPSPSFMSSNSTTTTTSSNNSCSSVQVTLNSTTAAPVATSSNPIEQLLKSGNLVSQAQLHAFVAAAAAAGMAGTTGSCSTTTTDNSAAQLLSKIPKSLTVIPQQKQRSMSRVSSNEDQNSA